MGSRDERKIETHEQLLEKAAKLFARHGFSGTSTADVARAAGVSHGAVFVHFPSRDALVSEVAGRVGRAITDRLHALATNGGSFADALRTHVRCIADHEAIYRELLLAQHALPIDARTAWLGIQSAVSFHLLEVAEREMRDGKMRRLAPHLLFNGWVGLVHHYVTNRDLFVRKGSVLEAHGPALVEHYAELVAP